MGLSDSERNSMIRSAVLIQSTRVTDGQTELSELPWHRPIYALRHRPTVARKKERQRELEKQSAEEI